MDKRDSGESAHCEPPTSVDDALNRSADELALLANFYHQHGFDDTAREVYRALMAIRAQQRNERRDAA